MGRLGERLVALAIVIIVGQIAVCVAYRGPNHSAVDHGVDLSELERQVPVKDGLAFGYYAATCSVAESIIQSQFATDLKNDPGLAAGLLRLAFHDCFVQGCDASILLKLSSGSELNLPPNKSIRQSALQLVDKAKARIEAACPQTVSCADIVALSAKVAVQQAGGPTFNVPLGRRDALSFSSSAPDLPSFSASFAQQSAIFSRKGLSTTDLVALAGAHTLGVANCLTFNSRLFQTVDPKLNSGYASYLKTVCPTPSSTNTTALDFYTPNKFDNQYFKNLPTGGALMPSDQNLDQDSTAWSLVNNWAGNQANFFNQFSSSFIKMSQIGTLTGSSGEIRKVCSTTNSGRVTDSIMEPIVEPVSETVELAQSVAFSTEPELIEMVVDRKADS